MIELLECLPSLVRTAEAVSEIAKKSKDAKLRTTVAALMDQIDGLQSKLAEQRTQMLQLEREREQLAMQLAILPKMVMRNGAYYPTERLDGFSDGPFCPVCFERDRKVMTLFPVRTLRPSTREVVAGGFRCHTCKYQVKQ